MLKLKQSNYLLPVPYPDEHIFSVLNRFWMRYDPILSQRQTLDIFTDSPGIFNPLNPAAFNRFKDPRELFNHTTYPYFLWCQTDELKQKFKKLLRDNYKASYLYLLPQNKFPQISNDYICCCKGCIKDSFIKYGEGYLLVEHQIDGARVCLKHNQKLIPISLNKRKPFFILDHSLLFVPAENPLAEETALTEFLVNPPDLDRKEINWMLMREIRKHTLSDDKQIIGEKINAVTRERFSEEFVKEYHISSATFTELYNSIKNNTYLHPATLGIAILGLGIED